MCGICGKYNWAKPVQEPVVRRMNAVLIHRGPDQDGLYLNGRVGLGSRRLSIIDLSTGRQPISNEDETVWIVLNGEIYNFLELQAVLLKKGHQFKTRTDTEVIVHLYEEYGTDCLQYLNGMFALAIWDERYQRLLLARDRLGEKPLMYAATADGLTFASEIQAVLCDPAVSCELDLEALDLYLSFSYIPAPKTILQDICKLPPAHYLLCENNQIKIHRYWNIDFSEKETINAVDIEQKTRELLSDSVKLRLISDVPLGAFLSGGIDSSTVVALMSRISNEPVKTFSIGFEGNDLGNHELAYARQLADRYHTDHHEIWVRPEMAEVLGKLVRHYGEPFGDISVIPTYYVAQAACEYVTVALTGDGGDELFGGYPWHTEFASFNYGKHAWQAWQDGFRRAQSFVKAKDLRRALGALKGVPAWWFELAAMSLDPVRRYGQIIAYYYSSELRRRLYTPDILGLSRRMHSLSPLYERLSNTDGVLSDEDKILYLDHTMYLPDDILVKVDIASMACSLETRPPFLDHRLVQWVAQLPSATKFNGIQSKVLLRRMMNDLIPTDILERPKVGFGMPVEQWMRSGSLYELSADILQDRTFRDRGLFDPQTVTQLFKAHQSRERNYGHHLYLLLVFELWARNVLDRRNSIAQSKDLV
jgi:asparagine synthase (glutamine-hydrolysing)